MPNNKRPFANLANIIASSHDSKKNNNNNNNDLKRNLDSPSSNSFYNKSNKKNKKCKQQQPLLDENDENSFVELLPDPTRTIENKIKNINIQSSEVKKDSGLVIAVKNRASITPPSIVNKSLKKEGKTTTTDRQKEKYYSEPPNLPLNVIDYDKENLLKKKNIENEPYYAFTIFEYLRQKETSCRCRFYMDRQKEISAKMRLILVDWLVEVQQLFELNHETLYLSIKIIDHYLMRKNLSSKKFQLLGVTSFMIAAKLDERICPTIEDFIYLTDDAYNVDEVIQMEIDVLKTLNFDLNYPLSYSFLRRYARSSFQDNFTLFLSRYILESSLMEYSFIEELDSRMAAASLLLAMKMNHLTWNAALEFYSGYTEKDLMDLVPKLNSLIKNKIPQDNIRNKYSASVFLQVACIPPLDI